MDGINKKEQLLLEAISKMGMQEGHIKRINEGFQNELYIWESGNEERILRLQNGRGRTLETIGAELDWIQFLSSQGIEAAKPMRHNGRFIELLTDSDSSGQVYYLTVFEKAEGRPVNVMDSSEWNDAFFHQWGRSIGRMHAATGRYKLPDGLKRPAWNSNKPDVFGIANKLDEPVKSIYLNLVNSLSAFAVLPKTYGLIHNDLHQGNFFVNWEGFTFFDFDDCAYNWFANDLAVSFYHAHWQGTSFHPEDKTFPERFINQLLEGYASEIPLHKDIVQQIPIFLKIREIFLYQLFLEKWDLDQLEDWQTWTLKDLKKRIEESIPFPFTI